MLKCLQIPRVCLLFISQPFVVIAWILRRQINNFHTHMGIGRKSMRGLKEVKKKEKRRHLRYRIRPGSGRIRQLVLVRVPQVCTRSIRTSSRNVCPWPVRSLRTVVRPLRDLWQFALGTHDTWHTFDTYFWSCHHDHCSIGGCDLCLLQIDTHRVSDDDAWKYFTNYSPLYFLWIFMGHRPSTGIATPTNNKSLLSHKTLPSLIPIRGFFFTDLFTRFFLSFFF